MKVNVTNAQERGVFDLTNRDTKTLQLALLQVTVIVPYTIKTLGCLQLPYIKDCVSRENLSNQNFNKLK